MLLANVKNQLKNIYPKSNVGDWSVIVQIAMSVPGLTKKLFEVGVIQNSEQLTEFARGFTYSQPLFSIVDVGKGKERADAKCREMARLMARIKQCKHLFFGPCHDTGYIPALQSLREPLGAQRITLVETIPALPGFRELQLPFTRFVTFRSTPLPNSQAPPRVPLIRPAVVSPPPQPRPQPPPMTEAPAASKAATPQPPPPAPAAESSANGAVKAASWAAMSKNGAVPNSKINIAPSKKTPTPKYYLVNRDFERVDQELPRFDTAAMARFMAKRKAKGNHCNEYHLKGVDCSDEYCNYHHGERLGKAETLVLQHLARGGVCNLGSECEDPDCYYGHHCRFGRHCTNGECKFAHLHHVDLIPCYRVYEDGTQEKVG